MNRTNSSASALLPPERRADMSIRIAATGTAIQKAIPTAGLCGSSRAGEGWRPNGAIAAATELPWTEPVGSPPSGGGSVVNGRTHARRLVADPDENPDQEERGVQRAVGLGQRADREVVLVWPAVDTERVPGERRHNQREPRRDAARVPDRFRRGQAAATARRPVRGASPHGAPALPRHTRRRRGSPPTTETTQVISAAPWSDGSH